MSTIVIDGKKYALNDAVTIESIYSVNKSFLIKQGAYHYGYTVVNNDIIPVLGIISDFKNSALGLLYKGKRFALLFDDIIQEQDSEFLLEDLLKQIIDWDKN